MLIFNLKLILLENFGNETNYIKYKNNCSIKQSKLQTSLKNHIC